MPNAASALENYGALENFAIEYEPMPVVQNLERTKPRLSRKLPMPSKMDSNSTDSLLAPKSELCVAAGNLRGDRVHRR